MKKVILIALMVAPMLAQAKVADFNALINENTEAQKELRKEIRDQVEVTRQAFRRHEEPTVIVDNKRDSINVPTDKNFLRFKKEIVSHQVSEKDLQKRLANEFKSADMEF